MRQSESEYWDKEADGRIKGEYCSGNIWKIQETVKRLLGLELINQRVLEIGVGTGINFSAINIALLGHIKYVGTDVSPKFCDWVTRKTGLTVVNTDIKQLPAVDGGGYTRVICLDSLEHVRPEDRDDGYMEIDRVMAKHGVIAINMPLEETHHDNEFDHPFTERDILRLGEITGTKIEKFEPYKIKGVDEARYIWVEMVR